MDKKNETSARDYCDNVEEIKLSRQTKKLLLCRAKAVTIYEELYNIATSGTNVSFENPDTPNGLSQRFSTFEDTINKMISDSVEVTTVQSGFKEL